MKRGEERGRRYTPFTLASLSFLGVRRSVFFGLVSIAAVSPFVLHCSASMGDDSSWDGSDSSPPRGNTSLDIDGLGGSAGDTSTGLSQLCGTGSCVPDDAESCELPGGGGAGGMGGEAGFGGEFGLPENSGDLGPQGASCQVVVGSECPNGVCPVQRVCSDVGAGKTGEPCFGSADCRAGLACVGEGSAGSCQPYCCRGTLDSCASDEFCDARPVAGSAQAAGGVQMVPVCVPLEGCALTDPFPCPEGRNCTCSGDRACVVVRPDGKTACAVPGKGREGDSCSGNEPAECAHGYVCSPAAGCLKLCSTVASDSGCAAQDTCQTPSDFPLDLGVCISSPDGPSVAK